MLEWITALNRNILWGPPMVFLILVTGLFLTIRTRGILFIRFSVVMRYTLITLFHKTERTGKDQTGISPFQAVCTALAATVGTGNIVGVALSIATGGPGAVFWLWISALVGMVMKYSEVTLSVAYRDLNHNNETVGGPMYYIAKGMGVKWLAILFAGCAALASFGIGASVQSNALSASLRTVLPLPSRIVGLLTALIAGLVLIGGIRRIANVAEILVPFMAGLYILSALAVCTVNAAEIPHAFGMIFRSAFTGTAATGGFLGAGAMYACRVGMARGIFTHEAGMGSAPIAHASAATDHPARQGLWGAFEVFFDSIVMCTITALIILTSGVWYASPTVPDSTLSALAFEQAFPGGEYLVCITLILFAFATIIAWYYYGEKCVEYLFPQRHLAIRLYQFLYVAAIYLGCTARLNDVWEFADLTNGLMAIPNLAALILLSPVVQSLSEDFFGDPDRIRPLRTDCKNFLKQQKDAPLQCIFPFAAEEIQRHDQHSSQHKIGHAMDQVKGNPRHPVAESSRPSTDQKIGHRTLCPKAQAVNRSKNPPEQRAFYLPEGYGANYHQRPHIKIVDDPHPRSIDQQFQKRKCDHGIQCLPAKEQGGYDDQYPHQVHIGQHGQHHLGGHHQSCQHGKDGQFPQIKRRF